MRARYVMISTAAQFALGLAMGALWAWGHMTHLRRLLDRVSSLESAQAARRISRTMPLRILAWVPALLVAALLGIWCCLGLVLGIALTRIVIVGRLDSRHGAWFSSIKRG